MDYTLKILFILLACGVLLSSGMTSTYGHGLGYELLPPVTIGDRQIALELNSNTVTNGDNIIQERQVTFSLLNVETGITVKNVTFLITAEKGDTPILEQTFQSDDGILEMKFIPTESNEITIKEEEAGFFGTVIGANKIIKVSGSDFDTGGLYKFNVEILTIDDYTTLIEKIVFNGGISFPITTSYDFTDENFGDQELGIITYYDEVYDIKYNQDEKSITYSMPFEWTINNINQSSVVHEEIKISRSFGDLLVSSFSGYVNGIELSEDVITIDDFSYFRNEDARIVHLVINKNHLLDLFEKQQNPPDQINLLVKPSSENLPLTTVTDNGQFKVNLSWDPVNLKSGDKATFTFDILDVFLKDKPVSVNYDLLATYDGDVIFFDSGISTDLENEHNFVQFDIPENVSGVISFKFLNLNGNDFAQAELPVLVNRVSTDNSISIPDWVRNNAEWWSSGLIDDNDFASGIEFMIKEEVISVPATSSGESSDAEIPDWVRNTAGWWANKVISDEEFANGLKFLIEEGIIQI